MDIWKVWNYGENTTFSLKNSLGYTDYEFIFQAEKPDTTLAVICGSLHVADRTILNNFHNFQTSLEK